jgi:hypothetical protein
MLPGQGSDAGDGLIDPRGQRSGRIEGAANDSRVSAGGAVQALEVAAVKGENNSTGCGGVGQNALVVTARLSGLLDGQDIVSQGTQTFHHAKAEVLIGVEASHAASCLGVQSNRALHLVAVGVIVFPSRVQVFGRQSCDISENLIV